MTAQSTILLLIASTLLSCQAQERSNKHDSNAFVIIKFDTAKAISRLNIRESKSRLDLLTEKISDLSDHIDTLELTYYFSGCDCQRWVYSNIYDKALKETPALDSMDLRSSIDFNYKNIFYIEPADTVLEIDWRPQVNGTIVRFIGRQYKDARLPEDGGFTVPDPPKGKVFRYYSYNILRPYRIWGPDVFTGEISESGDTIFDHPILTVK